MNPEFPVFIPTKGRYESPYTIRAFRRIGVPFKIVVEQQERAEYAKIVEPDQILVLPFSDRGLVPTRNWVWDYAQDELKTPYFWTFDDNITEFYRLNRNIKARVQSGTFMRVMESFIARYENVAISGMQYEMFAPRTQKMPPFLLNTRVYSNMLIRTDIPFRNRGFYNDDTDLCLRVLKDGFCTLLFNTFLIEKTTTMKIKGGMTPHYQGDGRWKMAEELRKKHPDVTRITWRWGRYQHHVDYSSFAGNRLIRRSDIEIPEGPNEYGMHIVRVR